MEEELPGTSQPSPVYIRGRGRSPQRQKDLMKDKYLFGNGPRWPWRRGRKEAREGRMCQGQVTREGPREAVQSLLQSRP